LLQSSLLRRFINSTPIQPGGVEWSTRVLAAKAALKLKLAGTEELRQFFRMALMCVADVADEALTDNRLMGLLSFDATLGIHLGPRSPTSLLGLYYRLSGETNGKPGAQLVPDGGMGAVIEAFQRAADNAGVTLRTGCEVGKILIDNGRAVGITTTAGEEFRTPCVMSAVSPTATFLQLVGPRELGTGFVRDIRTIRANGNVSRLNLALDRPPEIIGLQPDLRRARMVYAPSIDHVERGFNPSKYGEFSDALCFELIVPSESDAGMAPPGAATASISIQNTPYHLKAGWDTASRERLQGTLVRQLERLAPGIGSSIIASELLTPVDIEAEFRAPGGHWHHGELQVDRMYSLRPVFGAANYRCPVDGLYLCGAGTHPGGGVCGASGLNAARQVIADNTKA
jgi:phytoene dehydrogenase-like protein